MRKITKGQPPDSFLNWVRSKPASKNENQWFQELYTQKQWGIIADLSNKCAQEQFYICAYCCDHITGASTDTVNEHVEARAIAQASSLKYTNIVASCKTKGQCDASHKSQHLPLTPLMAECETEFKFKISGRVEGTTSRAEKTIEVLNLGDNERNNKALIEKRKQLTDNLLWTNGINPEEGLEDDDLLQDLVENLLIPKEGKLDPFAPVVANILRSWIAA
ncbi:hypothetical protein [Sodalis sp. RH16]|jgi:uncharacterized protein (TIGR02646 family)|uniref:hypothetical protein n=1 Tax=Sodalis sp. RH16 TaxID=3394331 RepID=UPI0039B6A4A8